MNDDYAKTWSKGDVDFYIYKHRFGHYCGYCRFKIGDMDIAGSDEILSHIPVYGGITYTEKTNDGITFGFLGDENDPNCLNMDWLTKECEKMAVALRVAETYNHMYKKAINGGDKIKNNIIKEYQRSVEKAFLNLELKNDDLVKIKRSKIIEYIECTPGSWEKIPIYKKDLLNFKRIDIYTVVENSVMDLICRVDHTNINDNAQLLSKSKDMYNFLYSLYKDFEVTITFFSEFKKKLENFISEIKDKKSELKLTPGSWGWVYRECKYCKVRSFVDNVMMDTLICKAPNKDEKHKSNMRILGASKKMFEFLIYLNNKTTSSEIQKDELIKLLSEI